ncbi:hypothetical protein BN946_scf184578.g2 [Trametes cinnabarina]|uniref:Uncharacterized protein n=1 Tax=Pycnoporus cinnabarinus TaxID=5643 RepID=A0A060SPV1_PYCCI|nr:hypothetical protein BN946_scf184578.g2 [Trametes cinnabarina]
MSLPADSSLPGEHFEVRQSADDDDYHPDPANSLPLSPARQALLDDILALYSCHPTRARVQRYTPDCVYDDQFVYANDRFKMAGQWFALPKLFRSSTNDAYQVVKKRPPLDPVQERAGPLLSYPCICPLSPPQTWTFLGGLKSTTINALVSLSLDPDSAHSDFPQADKVAGIMDSDDVQFFKADARDDNHDHVRRYDSGTADAPKVDY